MHRLNRKRSDKDLTKSLQFLTPIMTLSLEGVVSASYLMAILTFGLTSVILLIFNVLYYLVGFLSALAAILVYYVMISYPTSVMNSYKLSLSEEADMVFEQFIL
ncbi:MAG: hypothetical protein ACW99V_09695, partial [Candidatus Thorarchaeota archaeon]